MKVKLLIAGTITAALAALVAPTPAGAAAAPFAAQARAAGLTVDQARSLQNRVDGYLATNKGTQVAFDKIDLNGTGEIDLAYPGQVHPNFTCYSGDFCGYQLTNYSTSGDHFAKSACDSPVNMASWSGNGSYWNNQTGSVKAKFFSGENATGTRSYSKAAVAKVNPQSWNYVSSIEAC